MTIFQSAAAAVCSCLDSLAAGAAAATAGRFYKEKHLAACYSCLNWGKKDCIILAEEMFELCAFSSNSSSLSHNLHKKKPLDEVWLLPLISWFSYTSFFSFRSVTEFRSPPQLQMCHRFLLETINQPSPVTFPQYPRALRGLLLTSCFEAWPRRVLS